MVPEHRVLTSPLRIGPAGWSYPDWDGIVYPARRPRGFDPLSFLAGYFDLIEVNSTFYRIPSRPSCRSWAERVTGNDRFRFTVKLYHEFTHERSGLSERAIAPFKTSIEPLQEGNRLGAVLAQFPWSFRCNADNRRYIEALARWLAPYPVAFEVRHGGWGEPGGIAFFAERGLCLAGIDQPLIGRSLGPDAHAPAAFGAYFRLHGRNREAWFKPDAGRDARYDYLYSEEEMAGWARRIATAAESGPVYAVLNNHFRGQAVANALELGALVSGQTVRAPAGIIRRFPLLAGRLRADPPQERALPLFEHEHEKDEGEGGSKGDQ